MAENDARLLAIHYAVGALRVGELEALLGNSCPA